MPYTVFRDDNLSREIHEQGYKPADVLPSETIEALQALFRDTHDFAGNGNGGMFYSVYSRDLGYRRKVHEGITTILAPFFETHFKDHRVMLSSFVVKVAGPDSEFYLHQDTTGMDEWHHSPMSLWIPLDDVDENSGCLGIIPKSHHFFSPYRSISFPAPFDAIQAKVKQYLQPLRMRKGQVLFFDNRILHHSYINRSLKERIAVVCGIFPKDAPMLTCHKTEYVCGGRVELIRQEDDFLFTYPNFLIDCQKRPDVGMSLGFVEDPYREIAEAEFEALCRRNGLLPQTARADDTAVSCRMIAEPKPLPEEAFVPDGNGKDDGSLFKRLSKLIGL